MKRVACYMLVSFVLMLFQTAIIPRILPGCMKPDLLLVLVVYIGLSEDYFSGGALCWFLGCLEDVFAGGDLGLYGIAFLLVFLSIRAAASRFNTESSILLLVLVFFATLVKGALLVLLLLFFSDTGSQWSLIMEALIPQTLLNTLAAFVLIRAVLAIQKRLAPGTPIPGLQHLDSRYGA